MLDEFPDNGTVAQNIDHAEVGDTDDPDADLVGEGGDPIDKRIGKSEASCLECGGAGADKSRGGAAHEVASGARRDSDLHPGFTGHRADHLRVGRGRGRGLKADLGTGLMNQRGGVRHGREDFPDLALTASGEESEEGFVTVGRWDGAEFLGHGMSRKDRRKSGGFVDRLLEGEDADHQVQRPSHLRDAPAVPGPDLRADVVDYPRRDLPFPDRLGEPDIEPGIIDEDHRLGWIVGEFIQQGLELPLEVPVVAQDIPETKDAGLGDPVIERAAGFGGDGGHLRTTLACEADAGILSPK